LAAKFVFNCTRLSKGITQALEMLGFNQPNMELSALLPFQRTPEAGRNNQLYAMVT